MKMQLQSFAWATVGICAMSVLHASAFAANGESDWDNLSPVDGGGVWSFALNAAFALAFIVAARWLTRDAAPRPNPAQRANAPGKTVASHITQGLS